VCRGGVHDLSPNASLFANYKFAQMFTNYELGWVRLGYNL